MFGFCSTDSTALGETVGLSLGLLASTHRKAIYTRCPFHAGCRQILWHWYLGTGSLSSGRPQLTCRFYHFPSHHPQTWSGAGYLPDLFLLLSSVRGSLYPLEWKNSVLHMHSSKFIDDRNTYCPKFFRILASDTQNSDINIQKKGFWD